MHFELVHKTSTATIERRLITYCMPDMLNDQPFAAWSGWVTRYREIRPDPSDFLIVPCVPTGGRNERGAVEFMREWSKAMEASAVVKPPIRGEGDVNGEHIPVLAATLRGE